MKNGHSRIYIPCSNSTLTPLLKKQLTDIYGLSGKVLDFTLIGLPTQSYIVISIGEQVTPTHRRFSADKLARWFYNPSPLMRFYHWPTAGVPGWILQRTLRQVLRQRISSTRVTVREFYHTPLLFPLQGQPSMLDRARAKGWRGYTATIHRIHARTYYG